MMSCWNFLAVYDTISKHINGKQLHSSRSRWFDFFFLEIKHDLDIKSTVSFSETKTKKQFPA